MYRQPLGVVLIVMAALTSSFLITPLQHLFRVPVSDAVQPGAVVLGIIGAVLCVLERNPKPLLSGNDAVNDASPARDVETTQLQEAQDGSPVEVHWTATAKSLALSSLPLFGSFALLSAAYACYFVVMVYFNDHCSVNPWGYNAFDQVTLPLFIYLTFTFCDLVPILRRVLLIESDQQERFLDAVKGAFREDVTDSRGAGLATMFLYRLLINGRAIGYSFIATHYDLAAAYLQLTLVRVVFSWLGSLVLVFFAPRFIAAEPEERRKTLDPINLTLKGFGSACILGALLIMYLMK